MSNVVHHHTEAFQGSRPKQGHVPWLRKDDFIVGFVAFGAENRVTHFTLTLLLCGGGEHPLSTRRDPHRRQNIRRQPGEFRSAVHQRRNRLSTKLLAFRIASDNIELEGAHVLKIKTFCTYRQDGDSYLSNCDWFRLHATRMSGSV